MGTNQPIYPQLLQTTNTNALSYGSVNGQFTNNENSTLINMTIEHKLSIKRRFFLLLNVFDFFLTFLLWIICTVVSLQTSIKIAFQSEVLNYNIGTSMFDIVMLAVARLLLIILFYILIKSSHWCVIAITTVSTTIFIIAKVFLYKWAHSNSPTASVVLLLSSFVLSWSEAWFLDFRVLPSESKFLHCIEKDEENTPVLSQPVLSRSQSDDGSAFYSPHGSDIEDNDRENDGSTVSEVEWLSPKNSSNLPTDREYILLAEDALQKAIEIIESDGWIEEKNNDGDAIFSKVHPIFGKVFKFEGTLKVSAIKIIDLLYFEVEEMHKWNPTVKKVKIVKKIDDNVDITHVIATEGGAGLISSRDFVNVRIWKKIKDGYIHGSVATTHPSVPVHKKYVRGQQGPCAYILKPSNEDINECQLKWLLNTNLKGWIPQYLIDQTLSNVMIDYINSIRKYTSSSKTCN